MAHITKKRRSAFSIGLYGGHGEEGRRYRTELDALCRALDCYPTTGRYLCVHDLLGVKPGHQAWQRWDCSIGQGYAYHRTRPYPFDQPVAIDHSVMLIANDGTWKARLEQPYARLTDKVDGSYAHGTRRVRLGGGLDGQVVGLAPYGHGTVAIIMGSNDVVDRLAPIARSVLAQVRS